MTKEIEAIYQKLLTEIITLRIKPGARLGEVQLAERFGVSRTPMRDVLKQLESDGLLRIHSQSGSYVTKIDLSGISDIMYLRSVTEYRVMLEAIDKVTPEDIKNLRSVIGQSEKILSSDGSEEKVAAAFFKVDNDFHHAIFSRVGKASVLDLLNGAFPSFQRYRFLTFYRDESEIASLLAVHYKIVDCLEKKDKASLEAIIDEHNYSGLHGIDKVKERHPDYFIDD
jgi:DNA-binding GntR family transcriptional regulator